jgi:hypothetical protein
MAGDLEHDGLDVEHFVGVLAETAKPAAAYRAHALAGRCTIFSRGKCAGSDLSGILRSRMGDAGSGGNSASAVSSSSSASSSWAISLASFSEERPKCIRFNRAI